MVALGRCQPTILPVMEEAFPGLMAESPGLCVLRIQDLSPERSGVSETPLGLHGIRFLNRDF